MRIEIKGLAVVGVFATVLVVGACSTAPPTGAPAQTCFGKCDRADKRAEWVVSQIDAVNGGLSDALRAGKYAKMSASVYAFFRGTNHLYWADFAKDARLKDFGSDKTRIWLQGDLHAYNFGSYTNDQGTVVYDLDDYDEAVVADYKLDVWRLATSLVLVIDENNAASRAAVDAGDKDASEVLDAAARDEVLDTLSESYLDTIKSYRGNDKEKTRVFDQQTTSGELSAFLAKVASKQTRAKMLDKWTKLEAGKRVLLAAGDYQGEIKLEAVDQATRAALASGMKKYVSALSKQKWPANYFVFKSLRRRLGAGTGSFGLPRYYVLIEGATASVDDDRILDVKLQGPPSAYPYLASSLRQITDKACQDNHAVRAMRGAKALGVHVDDHLGWMTLPQGVFSVHERSPAKDDIDTADLNTRELLKSFAAQWGAILATAHARADEDYDAKVVGVSIDKQISEATDGKHKAFRKQVRDLAVSYARQVAADYQAFRASLE